MAGDDREHRSDGTRRCDGTDWPDDHIGAGDGDGAESADPRLYSDAVRVVDAADDESGRVVLVGVVHDHPASVYRAGYVVDAVGPDAVAVELPDLALRVFECLPPAADTGAESTGGGSGTDDSEAVPGDSTPQPNEMSAALAAGDDARTVGVDGIDAGLLWGLAAALRREDASLSTVGSVASALAGVGRRALACGVAGIRGGTPDPESIPRGGADYETTCADPPAEQAADERRHRSRSASLLRAIERPCADRLLDAAREDAMARRIAALAEDESVVAVVGFQHLGSVTETLDTALSDGPGR